MTGTPALSQVALIVPQAPMVPRLLTLALQSTERLKPRIASVPSASLHACTASALEENMRVVSQEQTVKDGKNQTVLTIVAEVPEVDEFIDSFFKKEAEREIDGFRKGHVPREVLIKKGGGREAAYSKISEDIINERAFAAIDDADVIFTTEPAFNVSQIIEDHQPFIFTASGQTMPILKLSSTDPVTINMPPEEATEQEISDHIQNLREYYYTMRPADKEAEQGDYVLIHMTCSTQGHDINGLTNVDRLVGIGQGSMPEAFDRQLLGTKAGQSVSFDFTVTPEDHVEFNTDGTVHVDADVKEVQVKHLPEVDEAFAQKLGSSDVEELHKAVRALINQAKREQLPQIMEDRCIEALAQRIEEPIPTDYVDFMRNNVLADFFNKLQEKDVNIQDWIIHNNIQSEQFKKDATEQAEALARRNVALESLFSQAGMTLDEADIQREFDATDDPEGTRKQWEDSHQMALFRQACRRNKVINWLVKTAEVNVVEEQIQSEVQ